MGEEADTSTRVLGSRGEIDTVDDNAPAVGAGETYCGGRAGTSTSRKPGTAAALAAVFCAWHAAETMANANTEIPSKSTVAKRLFVIDRLILENLCLPPLGLQSSRTAFGSFLQLHSIGEQHVILQIHVLVKILFERRELLKHQPICAACL